MNELEKKSFYSFLGLYILSSTLFILLIGYWYYTAQKHAMESETHYRLEHLADKVSGEIIIAHMHQKPLMPIPVPKELSLALIDTTGKIIQGRLSKPNIKIEPGYFIVGEYTVLISDAPREHLNIAYVVVESNTLAKRLLALRHTVLFAAGIALLLMMVIAYILSKLFMKPLQERVKQIERFINDVTHELNTPITALSMSTEQAMKSSACNQKLLNNISISTKQLYDIYRSLTYLNFNHTEESTEPINIATVLQESVTYYTPLAEMKQITFRVNAEERYYPIPKAQLTLLFGNLIGNAIKYSPPRSTITLKLKEDVLEIIDEGIGIERDKLQEIFEKFRRGTDYSGGFGVGLSIVKSICDTYGIRVEVDSTVGKGAMFRLYF